MRRSSGFPRLGQPASYPTLVVATSVAAGLSLSRTAVPFPFHSAPFWVFLPVSFRVYFPVQTQSTRRCWLPGHTGGQP